jgi:hypothetical protein
MSLWHLVFNLFLIVAVSGVVNGIDTQITNGNAMAKNGGIDAEGGISDKLQGNFAKPDSIITESKRMELEQESPLLSPPILQTCFIGNMWCWDVFTQGDWYNLPDQQSPDYASYGGFSGVVAGAGPL